MNQLKHHLDAGEIAYGPIVNFASEAFVEICGYIGFDFVLLDAEHGAIDPLSAERVARAAEVSGTTPLIRVPDAQDHIILSFLDRGFQGVQVPHVGTAKVATRIARASRYDPDGSRGLGLVRANHYGLGVDLRKYTEDANTDLMVIAQIEDIEGVDNLEQIVRVEGIDTIAIGPGDLAQSMGFVGQSNREEVKDVIRHVISESRSARKHVQMTVADVKSAREWVAAGANLIVLSAVSWIANSGRSFLNELRLDR